MSRKRPPLVRRDTVLVVDDDEDIANSLADVLATLRDVEVVTAADGPSALRRLQQGGIDLIISDYKMPGMDGVEFLSWAAKARPDVPRILITAFPDLRVAMQAINEVHIHHFFTKPLDPEAIVDAVWRTLDDRWDRMETLAHQALSLEDLAGRPAPPAPSGDDDEPAVAGAS